MQVRFLNTISEPNLRGLNSSLWTEAENHASTSIAAGFTTCDDLIRPWRRAIAEQRLTTGPRFIVQPHLLVIDEFGDRRLDEDGRSLLSEVINARYLKGSAITTPHVGINGWGERLGDAMLAAAITGPDTRIAPPLACAPPSAQRRAARP